MRNTTNTSQGHLFSGWQGHQREPALGDLYTRDQASIHFNHAEKLYADWPTPTCILSDGPYGVSGFPGDNHKAESLAEWYEPHINAGIFIPNDKSTTSFDDIEGIFNDDSDRFPVRYTARIGEVAVYDDLEYEIIGYHGTKIKLATPETLYRLKKDTIRDKDKIDALFLRELIETRESNPPHRG